MKWKKIEQIETVLFVIGLLYFFAFLISPTHFMDRSLQEDPMSVLGFGLLLICLLTARILQSSFHKRVSYMTLSGAIMCSFEAFEAWFEIIAKRAFLVILATMVPIYMAGIYQAPSNEVGKFHLYLGGAIGATMLACRFAFGVATGISSAYLSRSKHSFVLTPSHPDGCSGFGHLGYYYFEQALILLMPTVFMAFWLFSDNPNYSLWHGQFYNLIAFNLVIFSLSWM